MIQLRTESDSPTQTETDISAALRRLEVWIEGQDFKGWDPYDALNSPLLSRLTFGNRRLGQVWVQLFKRSPINLRPLFRVSKGYNAKGMALFLASYLRRYLVTNQKSYLERTDTFSRWLRSHESQGYSGSCWGYNFDWPNRGFFAPAGTPDIVTTSFIGLAFVDLATLGDSLVPASLRQSALPMVRTACEFILRDLHRTQPLLDEICFSYTPLDRRYVHNANVLAAWLLAEAAARIEEPELRSTALAAARYTARRQKPDGSWLYGEGTKDGWIDNFHTGYVLVALNRLGVALGTKEFAPAVERGYAYWKQNMFAPDGAPKYYANNMFPIDVHSAAQSVLTFLEFVDSDPSARALALKTARWAIENMQAPEGYFHFQIHSHYRIGTPYMRWSQAWMQRALVELEWTESK